MFVYFVCRTIFSIKLNLKEATRFIILHVVVLPKEAMASAAQEGYYNFHLWYTHRRC
jgi:hypothetical protein